MTVAAAVTAVTAAVLAGLTVLAGLAVLLLREENGGKLVGVGVGVVVGVVGVAVGRCSSARCLAGRLGTTTDRSSHGCACRLVLGCSRLL
jgi:hypothetical protein